VHLKKTICLPIITFVLFINGCISQIVSFDDYRKNWIGHPVESLKKADSLPSASDSYANEIGWKETTYDLKNGNWVYVELARKDCFIHWEVNPNGIILGSTFKGKGCK